MCVYYIYEFSWSWWSCCDIIYIMNWLWNFKGIPSGRPQSKWMCSIQPFWLKQVVIFVWTVVTQDLGRNKHVKQNMSKKKCEHMIYLTDQVSQFRTSHVHISCTAHILGAQVKMWKCDTLLGPPSFTILSTSHFHISCTVHILGAQLKMWKCDTLLGPPSFTIINFTFSHFLLNISHSGCAMKNVKMWYTFGATKLHNYELHIFTFPSPLTVCYIDEFVHIVHIAANICSQLSLYVSFLMSKSYNFKKSASVKIALNPVMSQS